VPAIAARDASRRLRALAARAAVIPVLVIEDVAAAVPLARALVAGGLPVLEVTLRTPAAPAAIRAMTAVGGATVGAGTLRGAADVAAAVAVGATFGVSPGATPALLDAAEAAGLALLPGAATASEAMGLAERGYDFLKFFPAAASGGIPTLRALAAPLPEIVFCPTGGISEADAPDWLAQANVACIGGSWIAPPEAIATGDWAGIEARARAAAALRRPAAPA